MGDFQTHLDHSANVRVCRPGAAIFDTFQNIQRIDKYVWLRDSLTVLVLSKLSSVRPSQGRKVNWSACYCSAPEYESIANSNTRLHFMGTRSSDLILRHSIRKTAVFFRTRYAINIGIWSLAHCYINLDWLRGPPHALHKALCSEYDTLYHAGFILGGCGKWLQWGLNYPL